MKHAFTKEQIKEIAEQLDCGFRAFYHKETSELLFVPDLLRYPEVDTEEWQDDFDKLEEGISDYIEVRPMESSDSFRVMADFAEQVDNKKLQQQLIRALEHRKPFSHFKFVIDDSGKYRQQWFDFKNEQYLEWVQRQIDRENLYEEGKEYHDDEYDENENEHEN